MTLARDEILARLRATISGWKSEVQASQGGLTEQLGMANQQLERLLDVLNARNEQAIALAAARDEMERLRVWAIQHGLSAPEGEQAPMEAVRRDMQSTFERLSAVVARWTSEMSGAHHALTRQIDTANAHFGVLLKVLNTPASEAPTPAPATDWEARLAAKDRAIETLHDEKVVLMEEARQLAERTEKLRRTVEERILQGHADHQRCETLEARLAEYEARATTQAVDTVALDEARAQAGALENRLLELQVRLDEAERAARESRSALDEERAVRANAELLEEAARQAGETQAARTDSLEQALEQTQVLVRELEQALEETRAALAAKEETLAGLELAAADREAQVCEKEAALQEARESLSALERALDEHRERFAALQAEHESALASKDEERQQALLAFQTQLEEVQREAQARAAAQAQSEAAVDEHASLLLSAQEELAAAQAREEALREEMQRQQAEWAAQREADRQAAEAVGQNHRDALAAREEAHRTAAQEWERTRIELEATHIQTLREEEEKRAALEAAHAQALEQAETERASLEDQRTRNSRQAEEEMAALRAAHTQATQEWTQARATLEAAHAHATLEWEKTKAALEEALAQNQETLAQTQAALEETRDNAARELASTRSALEEKYTDAVREHTETKAAFEENQDRTASELANANAALTEARSAIGSLEQRVSELAGEKDALEQDRAARIERETAQEVLSARLNEQVQALEQSQNALQHALSERERALTARDQRIEEQSLRLAAHESELAGLREHNATLSSEGEQLRDRLQETVAAVEELRGTLGAMAMTDETRVAEIENNRRAIELLKRDLAGLAKEAETLTQHRNSLEEAVAQVSAREEEARQQIQALEARAAHALDEIRDRENRIAQMEVDLATERSETAAEKQALERKLAETMVAMDTLLNTREASPSPVPTRIARGGAGMGLDAASVTARQRAEADRDKIVISERVRSDEGNRRLGDILQAAGLLDANGMQTALAEQKRSGGELLGSVLARLELVSEDAVAQALACQLNLPIVRPSEETVDSEAAALFHRDACCWHVFIPLRAAGNRLTVAMANPLDESALKKAADLSGKEIIPVLSTPSDIMTAIDDLYGVL